MQTRTQHDVDWVDIPTGPLWRGTPVDELDSLAAAHRELGVEASWFRKEAPRTRLDVTAFRIARTPVTWSQWVPFAADRGLDVPADASPDGPVEDVRWSQADAFCAWLSQEIGAPVALPTETQWERAARGDDTREYPWGDEWDRRCANTVELGIGHALPVGTLTRGASPFGVLDLAGNVDEWLADVYRPYADAPAGVPAVEDWALDPHLTRGGGYQHARDLARCARRHALYPGGTGAGLRLTTTA